MSSPPAPLAGARHALAAWSEGSPAEERAWFVPGRIEVLGKHTDYAGGRSLVCTVQRGLAFVSRPRDDALVRVEAVGRGPPVELALRPELAIPRGWTGYPATVVRRLSRDFGITRGIDLAFASDLPADAGLSSSTALCIGVFLALSGANDLTELDRYRAHIPDVFTLAGYLGAVENGNVFGAFTGDAGVGAMGGSQDQTAILCAEAGTLGQFSFVPVRFERRIPFPESQRFVIAASGVSAAKAGNAMASYNAAALAVRDILARWNEATGSADASLAAASRRPGAAAELRALIRDDARLLRRLEQFLEESEAIIPAAGAALHAGELRRFGELVDRSQAGAEHGLQNQTAETVQLQRSARALGATAASAFGGGFGGSVWAMIASDAAEPFLRDWKAGYVRQFPQHAAAADFFVTFPGRSAAELLSS